MRNLEESKGHLSDRAQRTRVRKVIEYDRRRFHHLLTDVHAFLRQLQITDKHHADPRGSVQVRANLLVEEANEFSTAVIEKDLPGAADALIDTIYVAVGSLLLLELPAEQLWDEVHAANMRKRPATLHNLGKRGEHDAVKPEDWRAPDITTIVNNHFGKEFVDAWLDNN